MNQPITVNSTLRKGATAYLPSSGGGFSRKCTAGQASSGTRIGSGRRHAFTLLEVMLSLILVSFVLTIVAMAIDIHLRVLDSGRTKIEEGQLARAILQRIADDLRNAVVYRPPDVAEQLSAALGDDLSGAEDLVDEFVSFESSESSSSTDLGSVGSIPGVYGESNWLQVDVMRLPRIDEYDTTDTTNTDLSTTGDVVSAVKTVLYFLETPEETGALAADGSSEYDGGLMRREMDRSATLWADQQGALSQMNLDLEPLAVEISEIYFEFYDGTEFLDSWDTEEKSGLPKAVLISIGVTPTDGDGGEFATLWSSAGSDLEAENEMAVYRLLVTLPISEPFETEDESTGETSGEASGGMASGESSAGSSSDGSSLGGDSEGGDSSGGGSSGGGSSDGGPSR